MWIRNDEMLPNYTFHLHLAIPPLLSAVVSCSRLHLHKSSGGRNPSLIRFLIGIISSSTLVVLCQLSGALVLLVMDRRATITHRYGILFVSCNLAILVYLTWTGLYICSTPRFVYLLFWEHQARLPEDSGMVVYVSPVQGE